MQNHTVLIVDDEILTRKAIIDGVNWEALQVNKVLEAGSAPSAREIIKKEPVDLALIDVEMPEESGLSLLKWIREESSQPKMLCSFLTCHASFNYAQQALRLGTFDYLLKPMEYEQVEQLIMRMIGMSETEFQQRREAEYGKQWLQEKSDAGKKYEKEAANTDEIINRTVDYIRSHLEEKLSLIDLAARAGLNQNYFNKVFKEKTGDTVNKFIIKERMAVAAALLQKGELKSYAIAQSVGYDDYANFVNMFKKTYGVSPNQYQSDVKS